MADMLIDEKTNKPFARLAQDEMVRGLLLQTWHQIGSSIAALSSRGARNKLTPVQDMASTYSIARVALFQLNEHMKDCPKTVRSAPLNKGPLDICALYHAYLRADDLGNDRPDSENDDRALFFIKLTILWVDMLYTSMEQTKGRKARAWARQFAEAVEEIAKEHSRGIIKQETTRTQKAGTPTQAAVR